MDERVADVIRDWEEENGVTLTPAEAEAFAEQLMLRHEAAVENRTE